MHKYNTIYADPPWQQKAGPKQVGYVVKNGKQIWNVPDHKTLDLPYDTMSVDDICSIKIPAADNSHLYLWATNKHLPNAFRVIQAWGFSYSTTIVWCKNMMGGGLGGAHKINTEFLLFATKGVLPCLSKEPKTWHNVKRDYENGYPKHSKKPEYFRKLIERVSPGPYLEMFARAESLGWDVFGNQVANSIIL